MTLVPLGLLSPLAWPGTRRSGKRDTTGLARSRSPRLRAKRLRMLRNGRDARGMGANSDPHDACRPGNRNRAHGWRAA